MRQVFFFLFLFSAIISSAQPVNRIKLDSLFESLAKNDMAMASIAISKNGKILYRKAIGSAYVDSIVADSVE